MTPEERRFQGVFDQVKDIEGWMGIEDCRVLYKYAKKTKGLILEIGAYAGRSTRLLGLSSPKSELVTIEPFIMGVSHRIRPLLEASLSGLNIEVIEKKSADVGKEWTRPIDLLLVDGSHKFKDVMKDIKLFIPHVRGVALFHDYVGYDEKDEAFGVCKAIGESRLPVTQEGGFAVYKP